MFGTLWARDIARQRLASRAVSCPPSSTEALYETWQWIVTATREVSSIFQVLTAREYVCPSQGVFRLSAEYWVGDTTGSPPCHQLQVLQTCGQVGVSTLMS